jgi:abortive infection bacteriophage resistance protein
MAGKFTKLAITVPEQIALLRSRGVTIANETEAAHFLKYVGYYRFCGYLLEWRETDSTTGAHRYKPGASFAAAQRRYDFDRKLRAMCLDAVERVEIALRAAISNTLDVELGPHWYLKSQYFRKGSNHSKVVDKIEQEIGAKPGREDRRAPFIQHYLTNYNDPKLPPTWAILEALNLGTVSHIIDSLANGLQKRVADHFGFHRTPFVSWLHCLTIVRNTCAHHSRLWDRHFTVTPVLPKEAAAYFADSKNFPHEGGIHAGLLSKLHAQLFVLHLLLEVVSPKSRWMDRLFDLLNDYPEIPRERMGFGEDWSGFP